MLWGVAVFFDYSASRDSLYLRNYRFFQKRVRAQGLKLLTIEIAFRKAPFFIDQSETDILIQLRSPDVLWQKEAAWNIAPRYLPEECDKIVFLDCDIVFLDDAWVGSLEALLDDHVVVQPYSRSIRLDERVTVGFMDNGAPLEYHPGCQQYGYVYCVLHMGRPGMPGYACAFQKRFFSRLGVYDRCIVGGGDAVIYYGVLKGHSEFDDEGFCRRICLSRLLLDCSRSWAREAEQFVQSKVSYLPVDIFHLWHGEDRDRLYKERMDAVERNGFKPDKDLAKNKDGLLAWNSNNRRLQWAVELFFLFRCAQNPFVNLKKLALLVLMIPFFGFHTFLERSNKIFMARFPGFSRFLSRYLVRPLKRGLVARANIAKRADSP